MSWTGKTYGFNLSHRLVDEDCCYFWVYVGLYAAKITLWAFESNDHLEREIAPRQESSLDLLNFFGKK